MTSIPRAPIAVRVTAGALRGRGLLPRDPQPPPHPLGLPPEPLTHRLGHWDTAQVGHLELLHQLAFGGWKLHWGEGKDREAATIWSRRTGPPPRPLPPPAPSSAGRGDSHSPPPHSHSTAFRGGSRGGGQPAHLQPLREEPPIFHWPRRNGAAPLVPSRPDSALPSEGPGTHGCPRSLPSMSHLPGFPSSQSGFSRFSSCHPLAPRGMACWEDLGSLGLPSLGCLPPARVSQCPGLDDHRGSSRPCVLRG